MATDVFNNPSNDYVYPALSPCAGVSDSANLEFIKDGIGIVSGSDILAKIDFSNLSIPVNAYSTETKIISQGEVVYIPGLTKGLQKRQQGFLLPYLVSDDEDLNPYFFEVDLSINYYKNFRFYNKAIDVSANYSQNTNIVDVLNIAFGDLGIGITASIDASALIFTGDVEGFDFSISNVILGIIDASSNSSSPFHYCQNAEFYTLPESSDYEILYAKYPNGAMQGIIMKGIYPSSTPETPYDKWLYINHVNDYIVSYQALDILNFNHEIKIDFIPHTYFGPFVGDISTGFQDLILESIVFANDKANNCIIFDCSINDSSIYDSSIYYSKFSESEIENSNINIFSIDPSKRSEMQSCIINNSSIWNSSISNSIIYDSFLYDVSIKDCSLYNCTYTDLNIADDPIVTFENSVEILIDSSIGIEYHYVDSSTYYQKYTKKLDVGMNGCSSETIMSAGDYLDYITTNNLWRKFGDMYAWTSAPDGCPDCDNLIDGFYVYNPHAFDVKIEYMLFV